MDNTIKYTERSTTDIFDLAGEIGGVLQLFSVIFSWISAKYSYLLLQAMITNRLYFLNSAIRKELIPSKVNITDIELNKTMLVRNKRGQILVDIPMLLPLLKL